MGEKKEVETWGSRFQRTFAWGMVGLELAQAAKASRRGTGRTMLGASRTSMQGRWLGGT